MTLTTPGIDVLARKWEGTCHTCDAEVASTGQEIRDTGKPGDEHAEINTRDCPSCGAKGRVYLKPVSRRFKDEPKPEDPEKAAAREARNARVRERDALRREIAAKAVATPRERPQPIPGFIEVTEVMFFDWDDHFSLGEPRALPETDEDVRDGFLGTYPRLFSLARVEVAEACDAYGQPFGKVCGITTLESYEELVARIAAAVGAPRQEASRDPWGPDIVDELFLKLKEAE